MAESRRILGESDWEDEDLLTQDEAGARLREEVAIEEAVLREAGDDDSSATVRRSRARLAAMRSRLEQTAAGNAPRVEAAPEIDV